MSLYTDFLKSPWFRLILVLSVIFISLFWFKQHSKGIGFQSTQLTTDYPAYFIATENWKFGNNPYDQTHVKQKSEDLGISYERHRAFLYPLLTVYFFNFFQTKSIFTSQVYFFIFKTVFLFISIVLFSNYLAKEYKLKFVWIFFFCLAYSLFFSPFTIDNISGQINTVVMGFTILYLITFFNFPIFAGIFLAIATFLKITPAFLVILLLIFKNWKGMYAYTFSSLILAIVMFTNFQLQWNIDYITHIIIPFSGSDLVPILDWPMAIAYNQSIKGIVYRIFVQDFSDPHFGTQAIFHSPALASLITNGIILSFAVAFVLSILRTKRSLMIDFCYAYTFLVLVSPLTWSHHLVVLFFPIVTGLFIFYNQDKVSFILILLAGILFSIEHTYPMNRIPRFSWLQYHHLFASTFVFIAYTYFLNRYNVDKSSKIYKLLS